MKTWPRKRIVARAFFALALAASAGLSGAGEARAREIQLSRYGARLGLSSDPDQLTLGAYAGFGELAPELQLRPSVDVGIGDDILSVIANADLQYFFSIRDARLSPYLGGGLGIAYYDFDLPEGARNFDDSTTEIGVSLYVGAEKNLGNYKTAHLELRVGIDELPDFKVTFGLGFY